MRRRLASILVLCSLSALLAAPASAGTVEVVIERLPYPGSDGFLERQMRYVAGPGERNRVAVSRVGEAVRITDPGRRLDPRSPTCRSVTSDTVDCTWDGRMPPGVQAGLNIASVRTLDGDDTVTVDQAAPALLVADGGSGSDVLRGSDVMGDTLDGGGGGRDELYGGLNSDTLSDGDTSGDADSDVLDAGADGGTLTYQGRTRGVKVDLLRRRAGEPGENDRLGSSFIAVHGGDGDDTLQGDGGYNSLDGGPGDDHLDGEGHGDFLRGGGGNDRLHGHAGDDYLEGGPGADQLRGDADGDQLFMPDARDRLACGAGTDLLSYPAQALVVPEACERLAFDLSEDDFPPGEGTTVVTAAHPTAVSAGFATFAVGCPSDGYDEDGCDERSTGTLLLRAVPRGASFGSAGLRWSAGAAGEGAALSGGRVRLSPFARRAAARRQGVMTGVTVRIAGLDTVRWAIRLRSR